MTDSEQRRLKAREAALLAELRARRSNSEKQAALITGDDEEESSGAYSGSLSTSQRQAAMAIRAGAPQNGQSSSVRQSRAARGIEPGEETERERKRRLIREGFAR